MSTLSKTSAYIHKKSAPPEALSAARVESSSSVDSIWPLLSTPQTVETLRRRIAHDTGAVPDESVIVSVLKDLLNRDLIEMSPDV